MIPVSLQILTNLSCNLDCSYCYEHKDNVVNDIERIKTYLYIKFKFLKLEEDHITLDLIGGESFLYPELCEETINYAFKLAKQYNKCLMISVSSNGTTLKNPKIRELISKYKDRFSVGISIDGTKENHDKYRIYHNGKGSYEDAIEYLPWLFDTIGKRNTGVKATFTLDTFKEHYAKGMLNLIDLGFTNLAGNIVFEDIIPKDMCFDIYEQFKIVIDYIIENKLENTVNISQLGNLDLISNYITNTDAPSDAWCGSCTYMSCLGLDGKIYGCNRFCTMDKPNMEVATFDADNITIVNQTLLDNVKTFKRSWDGECSTCPIRNECASCVAATYEVEDAQKYIQEKRQCGWTHAIVMARSYFKSQLIRRG